MKRKKNDQTNWDHRWFKLFKGKLFWYINQRSMEAQNKIDLIKADEIIAEPNSTNIFDITLDSGTCYQFKTESKEERDLWIKSLLRE